MAFESATAVSARPHSINTCLDALKVIADRTTALDNRANALRQHLGGASPEKAAGNQQPQPVPNGTIERFNDELRRLDAILNSMSDNFNNIEQLV